jgi:hypothetical protein
MLDNTKVGNLFPETVEFEWHSLTKIERRLIQVFRRLNEQERKQLKRLTELLAENPEEGVAT